MCWWCGVVWWCCTCSVLFLFTCCVTESASKPAVSHSNRLVCTLLVILSIWATTFDGLCLATNGFYQLKLCYCFEIETLSSFLKLCNLFRLRVLSLFIILPSWGDCTALQSLDISFWFWNRNSGFRWDSRKVSMCVNNISALSLYVDAEQGKPSYLGSKFTELQWMICPAFLAYNLSLSSFSLPIQALQVLYYRFNA